MASVKRLVGIWIALGLLPTLAMRVMNSGADQTDEHGYGSLLELEDFYNASLEIELRKCVITGSDGRQLKLGKELGAGAEGTVYKAGDAQGNFAAVKLLKPSVRLSDREVENLRKLSVVRSKHINNLEHGFEYVQQCCGKACLVTELISGKDAAKILWDNGLRTMKDVQAGKARRGALSYKLLRSMLLQAFAAFRDTEKAGLCNYDQHLRNVMFEEATERIVFIDFGNAMPYVPCVPTGPFGEDHGQLSSLQSWRSLAYLLGDQKDVAEYLALANRITGNTTYRSAEDVLKGEIQQRFMNLHNDEVLQRQLEALAQTGSPHIGKVSGPGPWSGSGQTMQQGAAQVQQGAAQDQGAAQVQQGAAQDCGQCDSQKKGCFMSGKCWYEADGFFLKDTCASQYSGTWCVGTGASFAPSGHAQNVQPLQPPTPSPRPPQQHHAGIHPGQHAHGHHHTPQAQPTYHPPAGCGWCQGCLLAAKCYQAESRWCLQQQGQWCGQR